jgi:hypothetical protein
MQRPKLVDRHGFEVEIAVHLTFALSHWSLLPGRTLRWSRYAFLNRSPSRSAVTFFRRSRCVRVESKAVADLNPAAAFSLWEIGAWDGATWCHVLVSYWEKPSPLLPAVTAFCWMKSRSPTFGGFHLWNDPDVSALPSGSSLPPKGAGLRGRRGPFRIGSSGGRCSLCRRCDWLHRTMAPISIVGALRDPVARNPPARSSGSRPSVR